MDTVRTGRHLLAQVSFFMLNISQNSIVFKQFMLGLSVPSLLVLLFIGNDIEPELLHILPVICYNTLQKTKKRLLW